MAKTEIKSEISLSTTKFQRSLARTQNGINNFAKNAISKFGAIAGAGGLGMLARSAIDLGSKISDMAVQMNIGTTQLQVLDFAAREAGVGTEILARGLRNVQLRTEEAIKGNKSYGDAFKLLNIDINEFRKLPTEKKLEAIAIAQSKATDQAAAYNAVSRILGEKAGPALQEVLQNLAGPKGYGGLEAAARRANEVMSKETIKTMDDAADEIESFRRKVVVATAEILKELTKLKSFTFKNAPFWQGQKSEILKTYGTDAEKAALMTEEFSETTDKAAQMQGEFSEETDAVTDSINDQAEATKTLTEQIKEYFTAAQKSANLDRETFVNSKKLEVLRLRAKGEKKAADELDDRVKSMEKAIDISNKYGISLREAANMVENINQAEAAAGGAGGAGGGGGGGGGGSSSKSSFDAADKNKSGIVTGREQRAKETANRKAATEARRARTLEVARESGAGERARDKGRNKRFDSREAAAGLNLAGNDPTAGRKKQESESAKQTKALESIEKELKKNPS